jgi:hypothetical protein
VEEITGLLILIEGQKETDQTEEKTAKRNRTEQQGNQKTRMALTLPKTDPQVEDLMLRISEIARSGGGTQRATPAQAAATTTRRTRFEDRPTPEVLKKIPAQIQRILFVKDSRRQTVARHVDRLGGDALTAAAAMTLTLRPSSARTYIATMRAMFPESRVQLTPFLRHSNRQMLTEAGAPRPATPPKPRKSCGSGLHHILL